MGTKSPRAFLFGVLVGVLIGALLAALVLGRYTVASFGPMQALALRVDRWTGRAEILRPFKNEWERVREAPILEAQGKSRFVFEPPCPEGWVEFRGRCLMDDAGLLRGDRGE